MLYNPKVRKDLVKKLYQVKHSTPQKTPIGHPETYDGGCRRKTDIQSREKDKNPLLNNCFSIFNGMNIGGM